MKIGMCNYIFNQHYPADFDNFDSIDVKPIEVKNHLWQRLLDLSYMISLLYRSDGVILKCYYTGWEIKYVGDVEECVWNAFNDGWQLCYDDRNDDWILYNLSEMITAQSKEGKDIMDDITREKLFEAEIEAKENDGNIINREAEGTENSRGDSKNAGFVSQGDGGDDKGKGEENGGVFKDETEKIGGMMEDVEKINVDVQRSLTMSVFKQDWKRNQMEIKHLYAASGKLRGLIEGTDDKEVNELVEDLGVHCSLCKQYECHHSRYLYEDFVRDIGEWRICPYYRYNNRIKCTHSSWWAKATDTDEPEDFITALEKGGEIINGIIEKVKKKGGELKKEYVDKMVSLGLIKHYLNKGGRNAENQS